ncbi:MAG TPA: GGDEF domain-containing protein [Chloroflexia bacterium]|nr:GGDEF domain-containing protein [Chloroflexia bacterium]
MSSRIARPGYLVAVQEPKKRLRPSEPFYRVPARHLSSLLERLSRRALLALSGLLVLAVGLADFFTGAQLTLLPFYLLPVTLVTWYVGKNAGFYVSLASSAVWTLGYALTEPVAWDTLAPYWNIVTRFGVFLVACVVMSEMKRALNNEKLLARTDPVTGASNSRAFLERVDQSILYARRYKRPFTIAYVDLDNFKAVNDHFGHSAGDFCLRVVASTILAGTRATDFTSRIGGDEFALLMPETGSEQARNVLNRLREKLLEGMRQNGWPTTFSIGVVTYLAAPDAADNVLQMADDLMYSVKNDGKNDIRYEVYTDPSEPANRYRQAG